MPSLGVWQSSFRPPTKARPFLTEACPLSGDLQPPRSPSRDLSPAACLSPQECVQHGCEQVRGAAVPRPGGHRDRPPAQGTAAAAAAAAARQALESACAPRPSRLLALGLECCRRGPAASSPLHTYLHNPARARACPPPFLLPQVAARIEAAQGEGFLRAIKAEWESHNKSVQMIRDILMYMDRIYVKQQVGEVALRWRRAEVAPPSCLGSDPACLRSEPGPCGWVALVCMRWLGGGLRPDQHRNVPAAVACLSSLAAPAAAPSRCHLPAPQNKTTVHQLGLDLWRDVVVRNRRIRDRLLGMLLDMVGRERAGDVVDKGLVRAMTQMLVDLGHQGERCMLRCAVLRCAVVLP